MAHVDVLRADDDHEDHHADLQQGDDGGDHGVGLRAARHHGGDAEEHQRSAQGHGEPGQRLEGLAAREAIAELQIRGS